MIKKHTIIVIAILTLGIGIYLLISGGDSVTSNNSTTEHPVVELSVLTLKKQHSIVYEELPGRTVAYKVAEIRPQVSGIITERLFNEGGYVKEGDQLYQIDPSLYQAELNSKQADLKKAMANVKSIKLKSKRFEELVRIDAISKQEYDDIQANLAQAEADVAIAEASVATAKINVNYTKVYAPISGRIGKSSVTKGALVTAGQTQQLATITLLEPIYVDMTQSSTELMQLRGKLDDLNTIKVDLFLGDNETNQYGYEGKLQFHEVNVDQTTGSVQLRALFPNPDDILMPGLFIKARLQIEYPDSILIPQRITQRSPDGNLTAWKMNKDMTINPVIITAKKSLDGNWVVTSGLNEGDVVVTEGFIKLKAGMKISPLFKDSDNKKSQTMTKE
jgi:membrane fusion protein (multidrug efflux system)